MNRYYLVQEVKDGKFVAYVATISESDNLLRLSQKYPDAFAVNACITKKQAEKLSGELNAEFKRNGNYMYETEE